MPWNPLQHFQTTEERAAERGNLRSLFRSAHALLPSTALFDRYVRCGRNQASYFQWVTNIWGESRPITTITAINTTRLLICDVPQHIMNVRGLSLFNNPNPAMTETASRDKKNSASQSQTTRQWSQPILNSPGRGCVPAATPPPPPPP